MTQLIPINFLLILNVLPATVYALAKELYPGKFRPTLTHSFIRLLASHSLLHTCFTQNIDTLERRAGVPAEKIIEAHGSFATQRCINCKVPYDDERMKEDVMAGSIPRCDKCRGLVKPDIVFFGEAVRNKHLLYYFIYSRLVIISYLRYSWNPFLNYIWQTCSLLWAHR